jgi:hypothetical protein
MKARDSRASRLGRGGRLASCPRCGGPVGALGCEGCKPTQPKLAAPIVYEELEPDILDVYAAQLRVARRADPSGK